MSRLTDWSFLSFELARQGIPSMVAEDIATNPEDDPWMPADGADCVLVWVTKEDAGRLAKWLHEKFEGRG